MILEARSISNIEILRIRNNSLTSFPTGFRLLHLLQLELMPCHSSRILRKYSERLEFIAMNYSNCGPCNRCLSFLVNSTGCFAITIFICLMIQYIVKFGDRSSDVIQIALCKSFLFWIIFQFLFLETAFVIIVHVLVPLSIGADTKAAKDVLIAMMLSQCTDSSDSDSQSTFERKPAFNPSSFLSVAFRFFEAFPFLIDEGRLATRLPFSPTRVSSMGVEAKAHPLLEIFSLHLLTQDVVLKVIIATPCLGALFLLAFMYTISPLACAIGTAALVGCLVMFVIFKLWRPTQVHPSEDNFSLEDYSQNLNLFHVFVYNSGAFLAAR